MKLIYKKRNKRIREAVKNTNKVLNNDAFYEAIAQLPQMDNTELSSSQIAEILKSYHKPVYVKRFWRPWSRTNAITGGYRYIRLNSANLNRSNKSIINTLVHEYVHAVDFFDGQLNFTHHDNSNSHGEENNTAPWRIGKLAEDFMVLYNE